MVQERRSEHQRWQRLSACKSLLALSKAQQRCTQSACRAYITNGTLSFNRQRASCAWPPRKDHRGIGGYPDLRERGAHWYERVEMVEDAGYVAPEASNADDAIEILKHRRDIR